MKITIGIWIIPAMLSLACAVMMLRPYQRSGQYDFGAIFRLFWLIPIALIWCAYFAILVWMKS